MSSGGASKPMNLAELAKQSSPMPLQFWGGIALYILAVEMFDGRGVTGYFVAGLPIILTKVLGKKVPTVKEDPMDPILMALIAIFGLGSALSWMGFGIRYLMICASCWVGCWFISPSRKFPTGEEVTRNCDLTGRIVYITGPTSGIGAETARVLCLRGAHVILASRNVKKLEKTKSEIEHDLVDAKLSIVQVDLGDQDSIRKSVDYLEEIGISKIDILINNAGVMATPQRRSTKQGIEFQVGVNHIGHFLLTSLLTPLLKNAAPSRVVCLSSAAHLYHDSKYYNHPKLETEPYHNWVAYGNAKYSNVLFAKEFNRRYRDEGITAYSVHPGGIFTGLQGDVEIPTMIKWLTVAPFMFKTVAQGCATTLYCATKEGIEKDSGEYFDDCAVGKRKRKATDEQAKILWETTEKMINA